MEALRGNHKRILSLALAKKILILILFVFIFDFYLFPIPALAAGGGIDDIEDNIQIELRTENNAETGNPDDQDTQIVNRLPDNDIWGVSWSDYRTITAYNSEAAQCDDSPCITANNFNLCEHGIEDTIAANFLPFGAKVRIPELFGDRVFIVRDRMNKRYPNRLDIWMVDKPDAQKFGVKIAKIEILH